MPLASLLIGRKENVNQMSKLDWLTEKQWTRGAAAIDRDGYDVSPSSMDAVKWDLTGALQISFYSEVERQEAENQFKKAYLHFFKDKLKNQDGILHSYHNSEGKKVQVLPLYEMNDTLNWAEVKKLLLYVG